MIVAELRNVTKRYGSVIALDNVSISVKRGQVLALLGPNGAGKTTAVRLLLGLSYPHAGDVRVFGRDPHEIEARRRVDWTHLFTGAQFTLTGEAVAARCQEAQLAAMYGEDKAKRWMQYVHAEIILANFGGDLIDETNMKVG